MVFLKMCNQSAIIHLQRRSVVDDNNVVHNWCNVCVEHIHLFHKCISLSEGLGSQFQTITSKFLAITISVKITLFG